MVRQVKLPDLSVQAVVDETIGEIQEKVSAHGTDDLLNTHPIIEDAVEDGLADLVVVQRLGVDTRRRGAEGGAAIAPGSILTVRSCSKITFQKSIVLLYCHYGNCGSDFQCPAEVSRPRSVPSREGAAALGRL